MAKCESQIAHHCPVKGCLYAYGSPRFFTTKKLLNQHKGKVHAEKKYTCSKCQKGFGTDWLKKNHEQSCGRLWTCTCGKSYISRESLLSHGRRHDHDLSEDDRLPPKKAAAKFQKKVNVQPIVFVIQPVIQQPVAYVLPSSPWPEGLTNRVILPKLANSFQGNMFPYPDLYPVSQPSPEEVPVSSQPAIAGSKATRPTHPETPARTRSIKPSKDLAKLERKQKSRLKTVAETQTCDELSVNKTFRSQNFRNLESRGSQCSTRFIKKRVIIESTHTQTTESTVIRLKKKTPAARSRRKSVAVVTDSEDLIPTPSLWSDLEQFMLPNPKKPQLKINKSSSTQTVPSSSFNSKVMCDSQTLTDELFSHELKDYLEDEPSFRMSDLLPNDSGQLIMTTDVSVTHQKEKTSTGSSMALATFNDFDLWNSEDKEQEHNNKYDSILTSILDSCGTLGAADSKTSDIATIANSSDEEINASLDDLNSIIDNMISDNSANNNFPNDLPLLSHMETQTHSPMGMNYNFLAHTETQTNDDFVFSDLEFSDTETQTPWEDISHLGDEFKADQLSIEIQTDFPMVSPFHEMNLDDAVSTVHMETQTLDFSQSPKLTNSESQTLILPSNMFM